MPTGKVVDLTERRLRLVPHVRIEANLEQGVILQTLHHPDLGDIQVGYSLESVVAMIEGLVREGCKLGLHVWTRWAEHLGNVGVLPQAEARAKTFVRLWRISRPEPHPGLTRELVAIAAADVASRMLQGHTHAGPHYELSAEGIAYLGHLTFQGEPLGAHRCGTVLCEHRIAWDSL
jgi:hypothetical protein